VTPQTRRESRQPLSVVSRLQQPAIFLARPHLAGMRAMISHEWFRSSGGGDGVASHVGLEGVVSKRLTAPYKSGPLRNWIKIRTVPRWCRRGSTLRD
jgi:hypothetical protein